VLVISSLQLPVTRYAVNAESDSDQADEKDCVRHTYVTGAANKPTPQCCADAEKVRSTKPKCLCLLIKESTDPCLGLSINTTLALLLEITEIRKIRIISGSVSFFLSRVSNHIWHIKTLALYLLHRKPLRIALLEIDHS
jgi:Probable lipid transfer